jgi:hypothetical protein
MNRIIRFFEEHVEKMVLIVVGAVCAWLLITCVIFSPNVVSWDGRNLSPSAVDSYVYEKARELQNQMTGPATEMEPYVPRVDAYRDLLAVAFDANIEVMPPTHQNTHAGAAPGVYRLPAKGEVSDVAVGHIRAVGYLPIDEVTPQNPYDKAGNEPNDIDLVSVEAKFDVEKLYENFKESFFNDVEEQWADPCLAKPTFAAVHLQRQQLTDDGRWSDWQDVQRAEIDHNKKLFEIVEDVKGMPAGGLEVQMLQFGYKQTQIELLQPEPYQFASAREEWFPPSLHGEFADFQQKELTEERRKAKEDEREARDRDRGSSGRRSSDPSGMTGGGRSGRGGSSYGQSGGAGSSGGRTRGSRSRESSSRAGAGGLQGDAGATGGGRRRSSGRRQSGGGGQLGGDMYGPGGMEGLGTGPGGVTQRGPRRPTINDVYIKYDEIALTRLTDFAKIREPLVFWAHDDTVEPENTYRYRIRLGVFNAIAGTDQMNERDKALRNQAILWSGFSDTTEPVTIMGTRYFFANNVREGDKTVGVQVCKLALGHWYVQDFSVKQGELVGESLEYVPEEPDRRSRNTVGAGGMRTPGSAVMGALGPGVGPGVSRGSGFGMQQDQSNVPEYIDYATGAVMVDAVAVSDWTTGRTMRARRYYDMLYSFDGIEINHMPVGRQNWPTSMATAFSAITRLEREEQEPFKAFGSGGSKRRQGGGGYEDMMGGEEMMYEESYGDMY